MCVSFDIPPNPMYLTEASGTVLLHLFAGALAKRRGSAETKLIPALYIPVPSPFPTLETFIAECIDAYNLDLFHCALDPEDSAVVGEGDGYEMPVCDALRKRIRLPSASAEGPMVAGKGVGMRKALELYKAEHPNVSAISMGTRKGDPHGGQCRPLMSVRLRANQLLCSECSDPLA